MFPQALSLHGSGEENVEVEGLQEERVLGGAGRSSKEAMGVLSSAPTWRVTFSDLLLCHRKKSD